MKITFFFKNIFFLVLCLMLNISVAWSQSKTQTVSHKGKYLVWEAKPIQIKVKDAKGAEKNREVFERGKLKKYDKVDVSYDMPKSMLKSIEKLANKSVKGLDRPKFNNRDVRIQFANFVVDTNGKLAYYEVMIFPYKESMQLYPNEYTNEIKQYLKSIDVKIEAYAGFGTQSKPLFSDKIFEL